MIYRSGEKSYIEVAVAKTRVETQQYNKGGNTKLGWIMFFEDHIKQNDWIKINESQLNQSGNLFWKYRWWRCRKILFLWRYELLKFLNSTSFQTLKSSQFLKSTRFEYHTTRHTWQLLFAWQPNVSFNMDHGNGRPMFLGKMLLREFEDSSLWVWVKTDKQKKRIS